MCNTLSTGTLCCSMDYVFLLRMFLIQEIQKGRYHITPLGEAVLGRNLDVAILLIEKGADIFFKSGVSIYYF